jgi:hypothetical protein
LELPEVLHSLLLSSVMVSLAYLVALAGAAVVCALKYGGRREQPVDDHDALAASRFTIPVSLIVPLGANAASARETTASLLALSYSEFEVIVVAGEQPDESLDALKKEWELSAHELFYRQSLPTSAVRRIYRSARDARLLLVEKTASGRADALNCGVNVARFRYASVVDAGVVFEPDALLRAMSAPLRDPANVVAASSHVEVRGDDARDLGAAAARQWLQSIRSLLDSRIAWRALRKGLGPQGAVVVWRRDALLQMGGFSTGAADPDLDMMVRLQMSLPPSSPQPDASHLPHPTHPPSVSSPATESRATPAVVRTTEIFGRVDAGRRGSSLTDVARRQRAVLEALTAGRRGGGEARRTLAYFTISQCITPLLIAWVVAGTAIGAGAGWWGWREVALALVLLSFGQALVSSAALLLRGSAPGAPDERTLTRLLLLAPCELVVYGPVAACGRVAGVWSFLTAGARRAFQKPS